MTQTPFDTNPALDAPVGPPSGGRRRAAQELVRLKPDLRERRTSNDGFSLVEMVMVIVIISIAALTLLTSFSSGGAAVRVADQVQAGSGVARACGERILRAHRDATLAFASITTANLNTLCSGLPKPTGYTTSASVSPLTAGAGPCPSGASCKQVGVSAIVGGSSVNTLTFMVVDY